MRLIFIKDIILEATEIERIGTLEDKNNKYIGIDNVQKTIEKISEFIKTRIEPTPRFYISTIKIENKDIIKIEVDSGAITP